ncbi:asparagine synthase-related protein [Novosphingobium barchaimii]|uniref:asparagine synthase-related protein n=1 Tax=Novosphingobium barchaimii TaxID=1420591 RepID=UPI0009EBA2A0|nr:asparagine synthetase B family protein [Novosphingobium barchaimii]
MNTSYLIRLPHRPSSGAAFPLTQASWEDDLSHSSDLAVECLSSGTMMIIGDYFRKGGERSQNAFDASLETEIEEFCKLYWGRFVLIGYDPARGIVAVYRDPSGMIPCYYHLGHDSVAIGSDLYEITARSGARIGIDWAGVAGALLASDLRSTRTCLDGISEIAPGELVVITQSGTTSRLLWDPTSTLGRNSNCTFDDCAEQLKKTLSAVVSSWCERYPKPAISVSGGFDSSLLASLAKQAGETGLQHFYTGSPTGDERIYARALGDYLDRPIDYVLAAPDANDIFENRSARRPRPTACSFTQVFDDAAEKYSRSIGATAHFNGGGGDNVFGKLHSAFPLVDCLHHRSNLGNLVKSAVNISDVTDVALPAVIGQALAAILKPTRATASWQHQSSLLAPYAIAVGCAEIHPWMESAANALPGQRQHLRNVARGIASTDYLNIESDLPTIYPLLSQPVVELCLSFPTWFWFEYGRDRSLARTAAESLLPETIRNRTGKGAFDGLLYNMLMPHKHMIFDNLENGVLAGQGLIDNKRIRNLRNSGLLSQADCARILQVHDVEVWCRQRC